MGIISSILDLIYPPKCVFCEKLLEDDEHGVCGKCVGSIEMPQGSAIHSDGDFCSDCVTPFYYEGLVRESILRYKFQGRSGYAGVYSEYMSDCIRDELKGEFDVLTWVPVSKKRLRKRGYDQARLLAESIGKRLGIKVGQVLVKLVHNQPQSGIGGQEKRKANVLGVYRVIDAETIRGKRVLIIDDIRTTGATFSECAKTLLLAGAEEVLCAAIAKTR